jgi:hypothetical protein
MVRIRKNKRERERDFMPRLPIKGIKSGLELGLELGLY